MNKLILVLLLAVCLVTAHAAIVKRDATSSTPTETTKAEFDLTNHLNGIKKTLEETFSPDKVKETFTKIGDQIQDGLKKLMPTEAPKA